MKKVIIEKTLYQFHELSETAKEKAIKDYLNDNDDLTYQFSDMVVEELKYLYGLKNLKTYYSLSYCQGDGLCLSGYITPEEIFDNENFSSIALAGIDPKDIEIAKADYITVKFDHKGRYYYANSVDIDFDYSDYHSDETERIMYAIIENIKKWYFDVCAKFEKTGYSFFYEMENDDFQEMAECNDWWFDENGKLSFE
ncbi:MAG: hypothetical protein FWC41_13165 [Firmicutes bacterium]|nr:hypothetical protein [Bacillota bacterium]